MNHRWVRGRRWGLAVASAALAGATLAGCGAINDTSGDTPATSSGNPVRQADEQALRDVGVSPDGDAAPVSDPSARPTDGWRARHPRVRRFARRHILHGEVTVNTKNGPVTIAVQRGTVRSVTPTTVAVTSPDGVTETWQLTDTTRVRESGQDSTIDAIDVGDPIGLAGQRKSTTTARLIILIPQ